MGKIVFHGHACTEIVTGDGTRLLIDPFLTDNQAAVVGILSLNVSSGRPPRRSLRTFSQPPTCQTEQAITPASQITTA